MKKKLETQIETIVKPRSPRPTVQCVDTYCELYRDLFIEVRAYESFKYLQLGLISDLKRKSLPAISKRSAAPSGRAAPAGRASQAQARRAKAVGLENAQGLHHFI